MTVWVRRAAWGAAALLVLVVVAAGAAWALFDADRTKQLATDAVRDRYQRTLAIEQPIRLALFPRPQLELGGLSLSERGKPEVFASVAAAEVVPRLWPLLRGRVVVDRIELQGVQATLLRRRDGTRNIDDLTGGSASSGGGGAEVEIGRIRLRDATLTLQEPGGAPPTTLKLALFDASDIAWNGQRLTVAPLRLELSQLQAGALTLAPSRLQIQRLEFGSTPRRLALQDLKLTLAGRQGDTGFEAGLRWPALALQGERIDGSAIEGEFKTSGASTLAGQLRSGAPTGNLKTVQLPGLVLQAKGRAGPREIDATLKGALLLQPDPASARLEGLNLQAKIAEPGLQPLAVSLQGRAEQAGGLVRWAVKGQLNDNRLDADGQLRFGGAVPALRTTARFDRLDLNRLLAPETPGAAQKAAAPADTPVKLEALKAVNAVLALSAGDLRFRQVQVADAKLDAQIDAGVLRVSRLAGRAWGGQIDGRGSAEAGGGQKIAITLTATGVDINALLRDVAGKDLLEGRGRVTADLRTQGTTLGALRSGLDGTAALQLRDGAVKGVNLAKTFRQARAALTRRQDALSKAQATEKTDFSELNVTARLQDGIATSDDLDLKSPFLRIGGAGRFDIGRGQVDYTARASVVAVPAGQDGAELAALKGVTVPVRLTGPLEAIDWQIRWSEVASAALKEKAKEKIEQKLGDKLKGLFGR